MTKGQKFTNRTNGEKVTVVDVNGSRVVFKNANGEREFTLVSEFEAIHKPATVVVLQ